MTMKNYTCWVAKRQTTDTMPNAVLVLRASHLAEAGLVFAGLDIEVDGLDIWSDTTREMQDYGLPLLPVVVKGEGWPSDFRNLSMRVLAYSKAEAMAAAFELAAWLDGTGLSVDAFASLTLPEWQEVAR